MLASESFIAELSVLGLESFTGSVRAPGRSNGSNSMIIMLDPGRFIRFARKEDQLRSSSLRPKSVDPDLDGHRQRDKT